MLTYEAGAAAREAAEACALLPLVRQVEAAFARIQTREGELTNLQVLTKPPCILTKPLCTLDNL